MRLLIAVTQRPASGSVWSTGRRRTAADDGDAVSSLLRQRLAGLLVDNVLGVPLGPVHIGLAGPLLVLAVRSRCATERGRESSSRSEGRACLHAPREALGDFLEQPAIAVRIAERGVRAVAAMLGIRTADSNTPEQVGLVRASVHVAGAVERLADLHAATEQLLASSLDVGNDEVQSLGGARCRRGHVLAEDDRVLGARRRELDHAPVVTGGEVGVEPPAQTSVELLCAIYI